MEATLKTSISYLPECELVLEEPEYLYKFRNWTDPKHKEIIKKAQMYIPTGKEIKLLDKSEISRTHNFGDLTESERLMFVMNVLMIGIRDRNINSLHELNNLKNELLRKIQQSEETERYSAILNEDILESSRIMCLGTSYTNKDLWTVWGHNLQGFCVELVFSSLQPYFGMGSHVVYHDDMQIINPIEDARLKMHKLAYYKKTDYYWEKEYRLTNLNSKSSYLPLDDKIVSRILLGPYMPQAHIREITSIAQRRFPNSDIVKTKFIDGMIVIKTSNGFEED